MFKGGWIREVNIERLTLLLTNRSEVELVGKKEPILTLEEDNISGQPEGFFKGTAIDS